MVFPISVLICYKATRQCPSGQSTAEPLSSRILMPPGSWLPLATPKMATSSCANHPCVAIFLSIVDVTPWYTFTLASGNGHKRIDLPITNGGSFHHLLCQPADWLDATACGIPWIGQTPHAEHPKRIRHLVWFIYGLYMDNLWLLVDLWIIYG